MCLENMFAFWLGVQIETRHAHGKQGFEDFGYQDGSRTSNAGVVKTH